MSLVLRDEGPAESSRMSHLSPAEQQQHLAHMAPISTRPSRSHSQSRSFDSRLGFDGARQKENPLLKHALSSAALRTSPPMDVNSSTTPRDATWAQKSRVPPLNQQLNHASSSKVTLDANNDGTDSSDGLADDYAKYFSDAAWDSNKATDNVLRLNMNDATSNNVQSPGPSSSSERSPVDAISDPTSTSTSLSVRPKLPEPLIGTPPSVLLQPREATISSSPLRKMRQSLTVSHSLGEMPGARRSHDDHHNESITAWEFLNADESCLPSTSKEPVMKRSHSEVAGRGGASVFDTRSASQDRGKAKDKGKRRAEVPIVELKVLPTSDSLNMFGSTQTSSNYSLSGKVVVGVRNQVRGEQGDARLDGTDGPSRPTRSATSLENERLALGLRGVRDHRRRDWLPEIQQEEGFLNAEAFIKDRFEQSVHAHAEPFRAEQLSVQSLEVTFTGYALYADHTGRFSACKLVEVTEEVLPHGSIIDVPAIAAAQEYGIEYTLSIPGWLPASLASRFGGTFYSLEARAKYAPVETEQERYAIPSSMLPPRRGSRALPDEFEEGRRASEEPRDIKFLEEAQRSSSEAQGRSGLFLRSPKGRGNSMPPNAAKDDYMNKDKETWLKKRAKRLSVLAKPGSSNSNTPSGSGSASPVQPPAPSLDIAHPFPVRKLHPSRGFIRAFSDPTIIVIRRCREVVPVPVARMAIVGPGVAPQDIAQDPPPSPMSPRRNIQSAPSLAAAAEASARVPSSLHSPRTSSKIGNHLALPTTPSTPQRSSSVPYDLSEQASAAPTNPSAPANPADSASSIPMRHFLHRPLLHPPLDAGIAGSERGLPFSLTLSLPSYVATAGPDSDVLSFAVQIEVGRSTCWADVRQLGGLRLREMELSCIQTERHCSVPSRSFCHAYPLPVESIIGPYDLPLFNQSPSPTKTGRVLSSSEQRLRRGYDLDLINRHVDLVQSGRAPSLSENNVERVRTVVVGPPPAHATAGFSGAPQNQTSGNRQAPPPAAPAAHATTANTSEAALTSDGHADRRNGSSNRGRRAYQSALRGLSNFATAVMDISLDTEAPTQVHHNNRIPGVSRPDLGRSSGNRSAGGSKKGAASDTERTALYSFAGTDGHGVDLTKGRVRMSIKLPLVTSSSSRARAANTPCLLSDFEGPYAKIRHKLQVKLSFGFGSKPLGGEGNWGQSLVMCVPVRFTDAAPKEVREQFAPLPVRHVAMPFATGAQATTGAGALANNASETIVPSTTPAQPITLTTTPVLPSYNQLFREDGSRLADDGEDLPRYRPRPRSSDRGSVTDSTLRLTRRESAGALEAGVEAALATVDDDANDIDQSDGVADANEHIERRGSIRSVASRLAPIDVFDESIPDDSRGEQDRAQQRQELADLQRDVTVEEADAQILNRERHATSPNGANDSDSDGPGLEGLSSSQGQSHDTTTSVSATVEQIESPATDVNDTSPLTDSGATQLGGDVVNVDETDVFAEADSEDVPHFAAPARTPGEEVPPTTLSA